MPSIGRPIGTVFGTRSGSPVKVPSVLKAVVSVGPYAAVTTVSGQARSTARTPAAETTSPPVVTSRSPLKTSGSSSAQTRKRPAVAWSRVRPCRAMCSATAAPFRGPGGAITTRPPWASVAQTS